MREAGFAREKVSTIHARLQCVHNEVDTPQTIVVVYRLTRVSWSEAADAAAGFLCGVEPVVEKTSAEQAYGEPVDEGMVEQAKEVSIVLGRHQRCEAVDEATLLPIVVVFIGDVDSDVLTCDALLL